MSVTAVGAGPGVLAAPGGPRETWGGRRATEYLQLTLQTYGSICWLCGLPGANSADHVIPIADGGAVFAIANLAPAHRRCNYARGARPAADYRELIEDGAAWFTE